MNQWLKYGLLFLSWVGSAGLGVVTALQYHKSDAIIETVRAKRIEVVDDTGRSRITLQATKAASLEMMTSSGIPQMRLAVGREQLTNGSQTGPEVPSLELGLGGFAPGVGVYASGNNRGTISFSNSQRTGKVMLGYFGTGDVEGVDDGMWGLSVSGRSGELRLDRVEGITSLDGKDTGLIWPVYSEELKRGSKRK